jgi:hypothetical protein
MNDLSALTPPLLVAAVVVIAVVVFLRHEMGRSRPDREDQPDIADGMRGKSADADNEPSDSGSTSKLSER